MAEKRKAKRTKIRHKRTTKKTAPKLAQAAHAKL
jgi:hypothetical protein